MKNGKIVEQGPYSTLVQKSKDFAKMCENVLDNLEQPEIAPSPIDHKISNQNEDMENADNNGEETNEKRKRKLKKKVDFLNEAPVSKGNFFSVQNMNEAIQKEEEEKRKKVDQEADKKNEEESKKKASFSTLQEERMKGNVSLIVWLEYFKSSGGYILSFSKIINMK
jgi:hypothetical protein